MTILKILNHLLIFVLATFSFLSVGQDAEIHQLDSTEFVHIHVKIDEGNVFIRIQQLPESAEFNYLIFNDVNNKCSVKLELNPAIIGQQYRLISLNSTCSTQDSFVFTIQNRFENSMKYPSILFPSGQIHSEIIFGKDCYRMSCIPQNDPWMPYVEEPFLISKMKHYLNPENGKIIRGKRIIRNGLFTACELESWIVIEEFGHYVDKNKKIHTGRELIAMKRLKTEEWDFDAL